MRRLWAAGAATLGCLMLGGVPAAAQEPSEALPASPEPPGAAMTIGFTNFFTGNDFFDKIAQGAQEAADAAGVTLLVEDPGGDPTTQASQVEGFITAGVDAIVIVPVDPDAIVSSVEAADAAGIPVLTVDRIANGWGVTSLIASDNVAGGRMAGESLFEAMGGSGQIIEVQGDFGSASAGRAEGLQVALKFAPDITLVGQDVAYGDPSTAADITSRLIEANPDVTGLFAHNDDMALGAIQAIAEAGKEGQIKVVGFDASPDGLAAIEAGTMTGTVAQQPLLMGRMAVETAIKAASGQPVAWFIPVETMLVTADNVDEFLAPETEAAGTPSTGSLSPMPALTEGTLSCTGPGDTRTSGEGWFRGNQTLECTSDMDDPRVAGPATLGWNYVCYPTADNGCIYWGDLEIVGPDGTWRGPYVGTDDDSLWQAGTGGAEMILTLAGSDAYEGWSCTFHLSSRLGSEATVNGLIYQGPLPPWEPLPASE